MEASLRDDVASRIKTNLNQRYQNAGDRVSMTHSLLDSAYTKGILISLVALNAVQLGLEADNPEWETVWTVCEHVFTAIFSVEALLKVSVLKLTYFADHWNALDFILVAMAVIDTWLLPALTSADVDLQALSILRLLRLFRLVRVLRVVKNMQKLVLVIAGVCEAIKATVWIAVILTLALYTGAIFCVGFLGGADSGLYPGYSMDPEIMDENEIMVNFNPYARFGSMTRAMLTLFNIAILSEWPEVVWPLLEKEPHLVFFFIGFAFFVTFGLLNVMIAIIVDKVMEHSRQMDREAIALKRDGKIKVLERIQRLVSDIDKDGDGKVFHHEIAEYMAREDSALSALLKEVEVPQGFSAKELVHLLDDNGDGAVVYEEFVQSFYRLVDTSPFQQMCLVQSAINSVKFLVNENHNALVKTHRETDRRLARVEALLGAAPGAAGGANDVSSIDDLGAETDEEKLLSESHLHLEEPVAALPQDPMERQRSPQSSGERPKMVRSCTLQEGRDGRAVRENHAATVARSAMPTRVAGTAAVNGGESPAVVNGIKVSAAISDVESKPEIPAQKTAHLAEIQVQFKQERPVQSPRKKCAQAASGGAAYEPTWPVPARSVLSSAPGRELTEAKAI